MEPQVVTKMGTFGGHETMGWIEAKMDEAVVSMK